MIGFFISDGNPKVRPLLHELRNADDDTVASEQRRGAGLQRLWVILQATRRESTFSHEEGRHSDAQTQTKKADWWGA